MMNKTMMWLAAAGMVMVAGGASVLVAQHRTSENPLVETDDNEGRSPSDGDYWAIRLGYGGDPQRLHFEPAWLLDSAKQEQKIHSALPAGVRTYQRLDSSALALNANA